MPHVTFIHGIANKPEPDALLDAWTRGLAFGNGLDLAASGVTTSMVYWADVLYTDPALEPEAFETMASLEAMVEGLALQEAASGWEEGLPVEERVFVERLGEEMGIGADEATAEGLAEGPAESVPTGGAGVTEGAAAIALERVPLPWIIKRPLMAVLLRDVHHYLFNTTHQPRPGTSYAVQDEIRRRVTAALEADAARPSAADGHVVVSHSMGTVIAYDCLRRVAACPAVDGLLTLGSPLGLDEVQDRFKPEWSRIDGFLPGDRLRAQRWVNVYDPLDPVCGFDPRLANDYRRGGDRVIEDLRVTNTGRWRHGFTNYARRDALRNALSGLLGL